MAYSLINTKLITQCSSAVTIIQKYKLQNNYVASSKYIILVSITPYRNKDSKH